MRHRASRHAVRVTVAFAPQLARDWAALAPSLALAPMPPAPVRHDYQLARFAAATIGQLEALHLWRLPKQLPIRHTVSVAERAVNFVLHTQVLDFDGSPNSKT